MVHLHSHHQQALGPSSERHYIHPTWRTYINMFWSQTEWILTRTMFHAGLLVSGMAAKVRSASLTCLQCPLKQKLKDITIHHDGLDGWGLLFTPPPPFFIPICTDALTALLKTLLNIEEAPFKICWTLMSVLYCDIQMDQQTARNTKVLKFMRSLSRYLGLNITTE